MRPVEHLTAASHLYPNAWRQVEQFRARRGHDLPKWPGWCFLPMAGWHNIVCRDQGGSIPIHIGPDIGRLAAVGTWRYSQGVYRFDKDIYASLWSTAIAGDIPAEVLLRLPEWCLYVETPGCRFAGAPLHGFFVHLEWDVNDQRHELRLVLDGEQMLLPVPIHLGQWSLAHAVERVIIEATRHIPAGTLVQVPSGQVIEELSGMYGPLLSLVLYLCSDEPDYGPTQRPTRPRPKRTKAGWRLFPASGPRIWIIGEDTGRRIRVSTQKNSATTDRTVRPHLRRAHWHGFWTGPRDGQRRFRYKWLSPIFVGDKNHEDQETL